MLRTCREYRYVLRLLKARSTPEFSLLLQELYGSADDAFFVDAPRLKDLAKFFSAALDNIKDKTVSKLDEKNIPVKKSFLINGYHIILLM